jgi:Ca-activated chloride channel family protein
MRILQIILRAMTIILLCAILFDPAITKKGAANKPLIAVDLSDSMDLERGEQLLEKAGAQSRGSQVLPFSDKTGVAVDQSQSYVELKHAWSSLNLGATNFGELFHRETIAPNSSLILVSDGWPTKGSEDEVRSIVSAKKLKIFPLLTKDTEGHEAKIYVSQLYAPLIAQAKKSVDIRATVRNLLNEPKTGKIIFRHDKKIISEENVTIPAASEELFVAKSDPGEEGVKEVTATFMPDEKDLGRSEKTIMLSTAKGEHILLMSGTNEDESILKRILSEQGYDIESVVAGEKKMQELNFSRYAVIIFNNIHAHDVGAGNLEKARNFIRDGGGFVMVGGNKSFGLGGYIGTPIEEALPVILLDPRAEQKRVNVALELVIDKSKSMAESEKLTYAQEAAREVVRNLKDDDLVGVIGFDALPFIVAKLAPLSESREQTLARIGRLFPAGRTNLLPALDEARRSLERAQAGRKHIIVLTDGELPDGGQFYIELAKQLRDTGITLSTVLMGAVSTDSLLREMAEQGGGAYYQTYDVTSLPRIFMNDIKVSTGEKTLKESTAFDVRRGTSPIVTTKLTAFPLVRGLVQTKPKENGAALELVAVDNDKAFPLLASGAFGKGRAVAYTSDATGRWSNEWTRWEKFRQFWSDVIDSVKGAATQAESISYDLQYDVRLGSLELEVAVYSELGKEALKGAMLTPDGKNEALTFTSEAPGRFHAALKNVQAGNYQLNLKIGEKNLIPSGIHLPGELFGEQKGKGFNVAFLQELAAINGGKINPEIADLKGGEEQIVDKTDLRPGFFIAALLLLLLEIGVRELGWLRRASV